MLRKKTPKWYQPTHIPCNTTPVPLSCLFIGFSAAQYCTHTNQCCQIDVFLQSTVNTNDISLEACLQRLCTSYFSIHLYLRDGKFCLVYTYLKWLLFCILRAMMQYTVYKQDVLVLLRFELSAYWSRKDCDDYFIISSQIHSSVEICSFYWGTKNKSPTKWLRNKRCALLQCFCE